MILKSEQQRLYALLPEGSRCFVRVYDQESALWVSDLPRRIADCAETQKRLNEEGFSVRLDEKSRLWYIDWTEEHWQALLAGLPRELPALPADEAYHEAYALCRLCLLHPSEWEVGHLSVLRKTLKLIESQPGQRQKAVRSLQEETAVRLREGKTIAHAAGRILAAWLNALETGKETKP